ARRDLARRAREAVRGCAHPSFRPPSVTGNSDLRDLVDDVIIPGRAEQRRQIFIFTEVGEDLGSGYTLAREVRSAGRCGQRFGHGLRNAYGRNRSVAKQLLWLQECFGGRGGGYSAEKSSAPRPAVLFGPRLL